MSIAIATRGLHGPAGPSSVGIATQGRLLAKWSTAAVDAVVVGARLTLRARGGRVALDAEGGRVELRAIAPVELEAGGGLVELRAAAPVGLETP